MIYNLSDSLIDLENMQNGQIPKNKKNVKSSGIKAGKP